MNFASDTAARYAAFNEITTTNDNLSTQLRKQEDQFDICKPNDAT